MPPLVSFAIIVGETPAGKRRRNIQVSSLLLTLLLVGGLVAVRVRPGIRWVGCGLLVGYIGLIIGLLLSRGSQFVLDGQVAFYEQELRIRELVLPLAELRKVEAHFTFVKGEKNRGLSGTGSLRNELLLYQRHQANPFRFNVLIESRAQRTALDGLLRRWRQQGLEVVADVY